MLESSFSFSDNSEKMTLRVLQTSTEKKDPAETKTKKHTEIENQEMGKVSKKIQCQFE